MDNDSLEWSAPTSAVIATAVAAAVFGTAAALAGIDAPGRLILALAGTALAGLALLAGVRRPRLAVVRTGDHADLVVRDLRGRTAYRRQDLTQVRVTESRRLGRKHPLLEIDATRDGADRLLIFTRWDLGADPRDVFDILVAQGLIP